MVRVSKTRRAGRRTLNMLAVATLTGLSMAGLSQEGCAFHWGVKQSYRSYIKGKVAKGNWNDTTGIGFDPHLGARSQCRGNRGAA